MRANDGTDLPFAVPTRLVTRKRTRDAEADDDKETSGSSTGQPAKGFFFSREAYDRYSIDGEARLTQLCGHYHRQQSLQVASTSSVSAAPISKEADADRSSDHKHLVRRLLQHKRMHSSVADLVDNCFRRISSLTIPQHEAYVALLHKRIQSQQRGLPALLALSPAEEQQWRSLRELVQKEQVRIALTHVFYDQMATIARKDKEQSLFLRIPRFADALHYKTMVEWQNDVRRLYPQFFEPSMTISLQPDASVLQTNAMLKHEKEVFAYGQCASVDEEALQSGIRIEFSDVNGEDLVVPPRSAISADIHAETIMEKYNCDVGMSASTLMALFDHGTQYLGSAPSWIIPIKSRSFAQPGIAPKKLLFLDKPLPGEFMSARERIQTADRRSLLAMLTKSRGSATAKRRTAYHLWQLGELRILVRCSTDAFLAKARKPEPAQGAHGVAAKESSVSDSSGKSPAKKLQPMSLFVKVDRQDLGLQERITPSEQRRFWLHSWLRGSSAISVARVDPESGMVSSWEQHSLPSILFGTDAEQSLECFEPIEQFQGVHQVLHAMLNMPPGNFLLRSSSGASGQLDVLSATSTPDKSLDLFDYMRDAGRLEDSERHAVDYVLPKWPQVPNRVPYSFRTGSYCRQFLRDGICSRTVNDEFCEHVHLRRSSASATAIWEFDDHSSILVKERRLAGVRKSKPQRVFAAFAFCPTARPKDIADPLSPVHCAKQASGECKLPHLTTDTFLELLADQTLRNAREKRVSSKKKNTAKRKALNGPGRRRWPPA